MALSIKLSTFVSAGYTNDVRWDLVETGTGILVDSHSKAAPHGDVHSFSFVDNVVDIVYTVKFYEETGGPGTLIKSHDITVSTSEINLYDDIELIVDGGESYDPVSGATSVIIPDLIDTPEYTVEQRAYGQLLEFRNPEIEKDLINGGFALLGGLQFENGTVYIIKRNPKYVVNPPNSQSPTTIFKDVIFLDSDITLTSPDFGKLLIVDGMQPVITITLPEIADTIEKVPLWIESVGTSHVNVVIKAAIGETITATGTTSNTFILGRAEKAQVIKKGSTLYGFTDSTDIKRVGMIEWGYAVGINRLWADGSELTIADYPRLKKAVDSLAVGQVLNYTQWGQNVGGFYPNKGYYAISNDNLKLKIPDWRNRGIRALKYSDGTTDTERLAQLAGGYQKGAMQKFWSGSFTNLNILKVDGTQTEIGTDDGPIAPNIRFGVKIDQTLFGGDTRMENNGMIPLIII